MKVIQLCVDYSIVKCHRSNLTPLDIIIQLIRSKLLATETKISKGGGHPYIVICPGSAYQSVSNNVNSIDPIDKYLAEVDAATMHEGYAGTAGAELSDITSLVGKDDGVMPSLVLDGQLTGKIELTAATGEYSFPCEGIRNIVQKDSWINMFTTVFDCDASCLKKHSTVSIFCNYDWGVRTFT